MRRLLFRLFFTKEDSIDLSQLTLAALNVVFVVWLVMTARGVWEVHSEMIELYRHVFSLSVILASPSWLAKLWIEKRFERGNP